MTFPSGSPAPSTLVVFANRIWQTLLSPSDIVNELGVRRRIQLMMAFALVLGVACLVGAVSSLLSRGIVPTSVIFFLLSFTFFVAYFLGRTQAYAVGSFLLTAGLSIFGYIFVIAGSSDSSGALFSTIPLSLVVGSVLLSVRAQIIMTLGNFVFVMMLPVYQANYSHVGRDGGVFLTLGSLLVVLTLFRDRLEHERLQEITLANDELKAIQTTLEKRVADRTRMFEAAQKDTETARLALEAQFFQINGQLRLSEAMRGDQDIRGLAHNVLQQVCRHLDAQVGALLLRDGDMLSWLAGYACSAEDCTSHFRLGEGLIGQVAFDQEIVVISDVPAGYLSIASGLGETLPRQILVAPFSYSRRTVGVIELGTLGEFQPAHLAFIERVSESIAIAFFTARARARIDELLVQTQMQANELQAQEEELRAINEHLEAQSTFSDEDKADPRF